MTKHSFIQENDDILVFNMDSIVEAKDFRDIARQVVAMTKTMGMDVEIRHPKFIIEVEMGTTIQEVVEAYDEVLSLLPKPIKMPQRNNRGFGPKR